MTETNFCALCAELAKLARRNHYTCEDTWYSCPKSPDGCANDAAGDECDCGADSHNDKIEELLSRAALAQPEPVATEGRWSEGVCGDGAAILRDGVMIPIEEVVQALNRTPAEPAAPTDEELLAMRSWSSHGPTFDSDLVEFGRRCYNLAQQHVSQPYKLPEPVPVSERLPGPEDCDKRGRCWWFTPTDGNPGPFRSADWSLYAGWRQQYTHWLPHWALLVPDAEVQS
jgi:hypothetical protein